MRVGGTGQVKPKEPHGHVKRKEFSKLLQWKALLYICGELGRVYFVFVGKEATKVLERVDKRLGTTWGDVTTYKEQLVVLISRIAAKDEDFKRTGGCFRWRLDVVGRSKQKKWVVELSKS